MSTPLRLTCTGLRDETAAVRTFRFRADSPLAALPGQAMTLAVDVGGEILHRTFSLSRLPDEAGDLEITIKAHAAGRATRWLHDRLVPGTILEATGPHGRFTLAQREAGAPIALVSAGSGATPLLAMLRDLAAREPGADVAWFHAARDPSEVLFREVLAGLQNLMPNLTVSIVAARPEPGWIGLRGRTTRRLMSVAVPDLARRTVFCCGPAGFMDEVRLIHAAEGGGRGRFHTEHFAPVRPESVPEAEAAASAPGYGLRIGEREIAVRGGETVLQAALRHGIVIPCGCGQGMCGTCRMERVSGEIAMQHQGGLSPEEEARGLILACSSRLGGDAAIRFVG